MQALKIIGFGLLFSFIGTIGYFLLGILIAIIRGQYPPAMRPHSARLLAG